MNNVIIMSFTNKGCRLAKVIEKELYGNSSLGNSSLDNGFTVKRRRVCHLAEFVPSVFKKGNIIIFIGAVGIAVRAIGPLVKNKWEDPAVVVVDELGKYVIPVLSGHIGGANDFANKLSGLINATAVITTATDINNVFAADDYAVKNRYAIANPECIKEISRRLLNGESVALHTPYEIQGALPTGITLKTGGAAGILISADEQASPFETTLKLMPKCFHVGIGARKNISYNALCELFFETLSEEGIPLSCVSTISTIDLKKSEEAIVRLAENYCIDFLTYSAEQLKEYEHLFKQSDFVRSITGVGNVCEITAYISSKKGEMTIGKRTGKGIAVAIAKEHWIVRF